MQAALIRHLKVKHKESEGDPNHVFSDLKNMGIYKINMKKLRWVKMILSGR